MTGVQPHFGPNDPDGAALLAGIVRVALPLMERTGVATAEEIGMQTFAQRLRDELQNERGGICLSHFAKRMGNNDLVIAHCIVHHPAPLPR
jgi:hypothetical protein